MSLNGAGHLHLEILSWVTEAGGGGGVVLPYITYTGMCRPTYITSTGTCAAQRGRDFEAPDLERGIHFRCVF